MKYTDLLEHPEGGRYLEVYRSATTVATGDQTRTALTHIYFSLEPHEVSRFHRVSNDEVWNLYQGEGLYLYQWDGNSEHIEAIELYSVMMIPVCHHKFFEDVDLDIDQEFEEGTTCKHHENAEPAIDQTIERRLMSNRERNEKEGGSILK